MIAKTEPYVEESVGIGLATRLLYPEKPGYIYKYMKERYAIKAQNGEFRITRADQYNAKQSKFASKLSRAQQDDENKKQLGFSSPVNYAKLEVKDDLQHEFLISTVHNPILKMRTKNIDAELGQYMLCSFSLSRSVGQCNDLDQDTILIIVHKQEIIRRVELAANKIGLHVECSSVQYNDLNMNPPMGFGGWGIGQNLTPFSKPATSQDGKVNYKKQNEYRFVFRRQQQKVLWRPRTWLPLPKKLILNIGSIHDISRIIKMR